MHHWRPKTGWMPLRVHRRMEGPGLQALFSLCRQRHSICNSVARKGSALGQDLDSADDSPPYTTSVSV